MVIAWRIKITVLDIRRKNVSVILEQVDGADPENIKVLERCTVLDALVDTPERK